MVPGSTLRYGSNFWFLTRRPHCFSSRPRDAAQMPLPSPDTTPPVTKMYFMAPSPFDSGALLRPLIFLPTDFTAGEKRRQARRIIKIFPLPPPVHGAVL